MIRRSTLLCTHLFPRIYQFLAIHHREKFRRDIIDHDPDLCNTELLAGKAAQNHRPWNCGNRIINPSPYHQNPYTTLIFFISFCAFFHHGYITYYTQWTPLDKAGLCADGVKQLRMYRVTPAGVTTRGSQGSHGPLQELYRWR